MHADQRLAQAVGQGFRKAQTNQKRADESRTLRDANEVQVAQRDASLLQRGFNHGPDVFRMTAAGQFRNHAPIGRVDAVL